MNPRWDDLAKDWGNEYQPEPAAADRREIPRPAGENAGLRDDARATEQKARLREPNMLRHPEHSRSSGGAKDLARIVFSYGS
jgi:hypothetical protein